MTMSRLARLLETTQDLTPTGKTQVIDRAWDNFNPIFLSKILTLDLRNNNIGTQKGIKWIAKAFDVSVDYLVGIGQFSTYDKEVLKRIEDIEDLPDEDKNHLFYVIDNLIKAVKLKSIA